MTFLGKLYSFECNGCKAYVAIESYPKGWFTTRDRGAVCHYCETCVKNLPKGTKIWPQGAKEQENQTVK